jgi:FMN phosphatase YigB (HAD superfamily)
MISGIRHIIFDLGGVLLNIDYMRTEQAFRDAGIADFASLYTQLQQSSLFDDFEMGKIARTDFVKSLQEIAGNGITAEQVEQAWNAMLLDFPLRRLQLLEQLRLHYDLFLLSNTNEIHEETFNRILMEAHGHSHIGMFFDRAYFSHRVGLRKPMREIFQQVIEENGLQPQNTLFIDDSPQHIEGASALGIQTIFLDKGMTIEEHVFRRLS